jgi:hypothetical protein
MTLFAAIWFAKRRALIGVPAAQRQAFATRGTGTALQPAFGLSGKCNKPPDCGLQTTVIVYNCAIAARLCRKHLCDAGLR